MKSDPWRERKGPRPPDRTGSPKDPSTGLSSNFRDRADSAAFYEAWVGAVLSRAGLYTLHHPFTLAETAEEVAEHAHTWDIEVGKGVEDWDPSCWQGAALVEVKSVNLTFHNTESYPFEWLLVCSQASWERKWTSDKTLRDFLFVSRPTGAILWLPTGTLVEMNHMVVDSTRNQTYKAVRTSSSNLRPLDEFVTKVKKS